MTEEQTNIFSDEIDNLLKLETISDKNKLLDLYNSIKDEINDEYRLDILKKFLNDEAINEELLDLLVKDLGFNFSDLILCVAEEYKNSFFLKKLDLFKRYIPYLHVMQLNEILIKSIKYNIDKDFNEYLVNCGADINILKNKVKYNVKFYKKYPNMFRKKTSRSCGRDRVLIKYLLDELGHPEEKLKNLIHVTGSNGKGSTCNFLKYLLEENGYKVNVYTNPSVISYRENYYIAGECIKDEETDKYLDTIKEAYDKVILRDDYKKAVEEANDLDSIHGKNINSSEYDGVLGWCFDIVMMILAFGDSGADFSIIEVRNGGLNDLTNVFSENETIATILTFIQYGIGSNDGTMPLYDENNKPIYSNKATAYHKAKLGRKNIPMIIANQTEDVLREIRRVAKEEVQTYIVEYGREWFIEEENEDSFVFKGFGKKISLNKSKTLFESFQTKNIATALATLYKLQEQSKLVINDDLIQQSIDNTKVIGRPHKILNGNYIEYFNNKNLEIIAGFVKFNESGVDNIMDSMESNNSFNYIIYTSNAPKIMKKDIVFFKKLKNLPNNNCKLVIYRKNDEVFEYIKEQAEINEIDFIVKNRLSSALKYVKEQMENDKKNAKMKLFILCDSMLKYDSDIEYLNGEI